jgi:glycerol-3-phosphate O-acyltransferase
MAALFATYVQTMYKWLSNFLLLIARKVLFIFVRARVQPENIADLQIDPNKPVCYVLQTDLLSNLLVLEKEAARLGLPRPLKAIIGHPQEKRSLFYLTRRSNLPAFQSTKQEYSPRLVRLVQNARNNPDKDVQLIPVTILWGRSPDKENSLFKILFSDSWAPPSSFKQLITVLLHGRQTLVKFGAPLSVHSLVQEESCTEEICLRKISRVLRVHFRRHREMAIGPDLSHRRTLVKTLLQSDSIQKSIFEEAADKNISREKATERAAKYADEIAADYSHPVIRFFDIILTWLWTKLYDGVDVHHFDDVRKLAADHEIVYVPCHRSHIDYLLLSYVIYYRGLMTPHIAAGSNLNLPVVGSILRRGGAFFLRRSFKGNFLYAAVFNEYLHLMTVKGYSIEYFIEGGRSRTGRLLSPRIGMLNMTLKSYTRDNARPIVFIPAYIGYEKLLEGKTYIGELAGKPKQKESIWGLMSAARNIQKIFGKVQLSFGEPIYLEPLLDKKKPDWREAKDDDWMNSISSDLAQTINTNINSAAAVNPINLISLILLSTAKHTIDESTLIKQLDLYKHILLKVPYSNRLTVTPLSGKDIIAYAEKLKIVYRIKHPLGDLIGVTQEQALLLTYFRNNTLHLFTIPSLLACLIQHNNELNREQIFQIAKSIYPFMRAELFLPWCDKQVEGVISEWLNTFIELGLCIKRNDQLIISPSPNSESYSELLLLAQSVQQNLERYYMTISLLTQLGSGTVNSKKLEEMCHLLAQRLSILLAFSAPEFSDKALFRSFIETLIKQNVVSLDEQQNLIYDERLITIAAESQFVLSAEIRQNIQRMTRIDPDDLAAAIPEKAKK